MTMEKLREYLTGRAMSDLILIGFVDGDETPSRYRPYLQSFFLEFGDSRIELRVKGTTGAMSILIDTPIECDAFRAEELEVVQMSLRNVMLRGVETARLLQLTLWNVCEAEGAISCDALEIELEYQTIFFDPSCWFGLQVGGVEQKRIWQQHYWPKAETVSVTRINFDTLYYTRNPLR